MIMVLTFLKGCQKKIKTCFISSKSAGQGIMGFSFRKAGSCLMFGGMTLKNKSNSRLEQITFLVVVSFLLIVLHQKLNRHFLFLDILNNFGADAVNALL